MPAIKRETLYGWGHCPVAECDSYRPEKRRDLLALVKQHTGPMIARGLGRSYGDAALQPEGVVRTERLDHFIEFDPDQGILRAQAGVTLAQVLEMAIPHGWFLPVIPGTRFVTLGGAFACNVHGKNQFKEGELAEHVISIQITLASGDSITCTPQGHPELFWATAGGMGMTGIIEEVTLQLLPIRSASLRNTTYRVQSIEDMIAAFEHYRESADYMVGWIDHMARGEHIGRGVFEAASHISADEGGAPLESYVPPRIKRKVPMWMPSFVLNRYLMAIYNKWRFKKYSDERAIEIVDFDGFFHPLDSIAHWNKLYGKRGFFQYQCLLPETAGIDAKVKALLATIHKQKCFSFLAVIKYHREGKGLLTFSKAGYSIALDFPNTRRVRKLLPQIDKWVADQGGRVYLAKDALLSPDLFTRMYPNAGEWCDLIRDTDPHSRFVSLMSQRLQWKAPA